jgi:hypothetical protein
MEELQKEETTPINRSVSTHTSQLQPKTNDIPKVKPVGNQILYSEMVASRPLEATSSRASTLPKTTAPTVSSPAPTNNSSTPLNGKTPGPSQC